MKNKKNIWLTVAIVALCATTAFGQNVENDSISPFQEMQRVTETFRYNPLLDYGDQMNILGRETDTRTSVERDRKGSITITQDANTIYGFYGALALGGEVDFNKETKAFGPCFHATVGYFGPWFDISADVSYARHADPQEIGEKYWAGAAFARFAVAPLRWPKEIDYHRFYFGWQAGLQQSRTAPIYNFRDPVTGLEVDIKQGSDAFGFATGPFLGYEYRPFSKRVHVGVEASAWGYGGKTAYKIDTNGDIVADESSKIRMFHVELKIFVKGILGRKAASQKTYSASQWQKMVAASKAMMNEGSSSAEE